MDEKWHFKWCFVLLFTAAQSHSMRWYSLAKFAGENHANYATYNPNSLKSCYFVENWLLCECFYCRHYRNVLGQGCTDTKLAVVFCIWMCCTTMNGFIARAFVARSLKTTKCPNQIRVIFGSSSKTLLNPMIWNRWEKSTGVIGPWCVCACVSVKMKIIAAKSSSSTVSWP